MLKLDKYEKALFYEIFNKNEYGVLDNFIETSEVIFDLWWHTGLFSLYILCYKYWILANISDNAIYIDPISVSKKFKIHYFEPAETFYRKAKELLFDNFGDNIIFNNFWVDKESSKKILKINEKISSQSSLYPSFLNKGWKDKECNFINLNEYIKDNEITRIDILKMDIEWSEFDVLLNLKTENFRKIRILFLEYHILNNDMKNNFPILKKRLATFYRNIKIYSSEYNDNIWYIFCYD